MFAAILAATPKINLRNPLHAADKAHKKHLCPLKIKKKNNLQSVA